LGNPKATAAEDRLSIRRNSIHNDFGSESSQCHRGVLFSHTLMLVVACWAGGDGGSVFEHGERGKSPQ